jgi:molybdate-binding protein/DNA-binding XRE family transcriptional regulator
MPVHTHLQQIRKARGVSAADLARRVGVSRQTIYAIEDGSYLPNTAVSLQLSRALDVKVEEIFSWADEDTVEPVSADLLSNTQADGGGLVKVCRVNERMIAVPVSSLPAYFPSADGMIESRTKLTASIQLPAGLPESGKRLLVAGCDPALSLLNETLHASGIEIVNISCSSRCALQWLKQGKVHAAGSHLLDRATGEYNVPFIRRLLPSEPVRVVTFAVWEQGMVLPRGNPKGIRSVADLGSSGITIINREPGSGSRNLLDAHLRQAGIASKQIKGYDSHAPGHLAAAYAVAAGTADCCIAPRSAARCFGLEFVPLAVERFDLAFTGTSLELPAVKALLDTLNRSHLRRKLQCMAGYDTAHTGEVLV